MIKMCACEDEFEKLMDKNVLEECLDSHLDTIWKNCSPIELLIKALHDFNLDLKVKKGTGNTQVPNFIIIPDKTLILRVSNEDTVCGKKQILYFFLDYVITGKIRDELKHSLFEISNQGILVHYSREPADKHELTENPGLNANSETLLLILRSK